MFAIGIADGAVMANPVRDASARLNTSAKKAPRALTVEDTERLVELFHSSPRAAELDEAGFTPRQVADQLGRANPSMTLDVYFGRQVVSAEAARVLDR